MSRVLSDLQRSFGLVVDSPFVLHLLCMFRPILQQYADSQEVSCHMLDV